MLRNTLNNIAAATPGQASPPRTPSRTRLEASYQTTSLLARLSLVNYLG